MNEEIRRVSIRFSGGFNARLADIERYWTRVDHPSGFMRLTDSISEKVIPLLKRFPAIGRLVFNSEPKTVDALLMLEDIVNMTKAGTPLRGSLHEYIFDDYVLLYLLSDGTVTFLWLRHTKELSPDFDDLWGPEP